MPPPRSRSFVFTYNKPHITPASFDEALAALPYHRYSVFQCEIGEECRTPHYQGYIEFHRTCTPIRLNAIGLAGRSFLVKRVMGQGRRPVNMRRARTSAPALSTSLSLTCLETLSPSPPRSLPPAAPLSPVYGGQVAAVAAPIFTPWQSSPGRPGQ
nr:hypothetical protein [uncultured bacterium]AUH21341.1 hypothetical protein [uncultured bacterium]AUH21347.1 hypothetical protein [uncultured bacterium]